LVEKWQDTLPSGCIIKEASVDRPSEESPCQSHFGLVQESTESELVLRYQWSKADRSLSNFVPIPDATNEVKLPCHTSIGMCAKRFCFLILSVMYYRSIGQNMKTLAKFLRLNVLLLLERLNIHPYLPYLRQFYEVCFFSNTIGQMEVFHCLAISVLHIFLYWRPVENNTVKRCAGKGIPKVVSLELHGELVEGNILKGQAVVAWCGGTPGKCITRWVMFAAFPFCYMPLSKKLCIPVSW